MIFRSAEGDRDHRSYSSSHRVSVSRTHIIMEGALPPCQTINRRQGKKREGRREKRERERERESQSEHIESRKGKHRGGACCATNERQNGKDEMIIISFVATSFDAMVQNPFRL